MKTNKRIYIIIFTILIICFFNDANAYSKAAVDITKMNIFEIQEAIDDGYLTYELLTRLYLDRIEAYDKDFNTIITLNENAIEEAKEKDNIYKKKGRDSILFGIPVVVKDNIDVKGLPTTAGTKTLKDSYPNDDAEIIKNIKEQGAIILAKTNMSEFAFSSSSSTSSYNTVKNAYNFEYSSYGSSGGTAVAISLQFALLGIGTDTNASIRVPSSTANVIGFRPTLEKFKTDGIILYDVTRDTPGPITKTVEENALLMAAMSGNNGLSFDIDDYNLQGVRIGVLNDFLEGNDSLVYGSGETYQEIKDLMNQKLNKLKKQGATIVEINNFYKQEYYDIEESTLAGWTMCNYFNKYIKNTSSDIDNFYDLTYSSGHIYSLWSYVTDCGRNIKRIEDYDEEKEVFLEDIEKLYEDNNLNFLVYPTTKNKVIKANNEDVNNFITPSFLIAPVLGLPSSTVSIGSDSDGLYYGMDIIGLKDQEEEIYKFMYQYEKINYTYSLSSLANPLYEVPKEVEKLKNLYSSYKNLKTPIKNNNYNKIKKEVEEFLFNYNSYDDNTLKDDANKLYSSYNKILNEIHKKLIKLIIIIVLFITILLITVIMVKKRRNRLI